MDDNKELAESIIFDNSTKSNKKQYLQRFRDSWKDETNFQGWLERPKNKDKGFTGHCKICKVDMKGSKTLLERHVFTNKHKKNSKLLGLPLPTESYLSPVNNEELKEECNILYKDEYHHLDELAGDIIYENEESRLVEDEFTDYKLYESKKRMSVKNEQLGPVLVQIDNLDSKLKSPKSINLVPASQFLIQNREDSLGLDDHLTTFGLYVGNELRRIDSVYAKQLAKCKINNVIFDATTGAYNINR